MYESGEYCVHEGRSSVEGSIVDENAYNCLFVFPYYWVNLKFIVSIRAHSNRV